MKILALLALLALGQPFLGAADAGAAPAVAGAQAEAAHQPAGPERWEKEIKAFEAADAKSLPAPGGNVFVGSSSIVKWQTLLQDFAPAPVIKRGFGGSQISDSLFYAERIILPYKPKRVFVYAGDNDLAAKRTPAQVAGDFAGITAKVHAALPAARIYFIAIKPSPARVKLMPEITQTNALVKAFTATHPEAGLIDICTPMLSAEGQPRPELFGDDKLHMNEMGYAIWVGIIKPLLAD